MATKRILRKSPSQQPSKLDKSKTPPDIVNQFLAMNGRIQFHYGEVISRKFTGPNVFVEEGFWFGDIYENDEEMKSYKVPYKLTAVMGAPVAQDIATKRQP